MCCALLPPDGPVRPSTRVKCRSIPYPRTTGTSCSWTYMLSSDWLRPASCHWASSSSAPAVRPQTTRCSM